MFSGVMWPKTHVVVLGCTDSMWPSGRFPHPCDSTDVEPHIPGDFPVGLVSEESNEAARCFDCHAVAWQLRSAPRLGDHPVFADCSWIEDDNHTLNLQNLADRHHLRDDAATAEDMAIRWADERFPR
jgi:hypothetical protein